MPKEFESLGGVCRRAYRLSSGIIVVNWVKQVWMTFFRRVALDRLERLYFADYRLFGSIYSYRRDVLVTLFWTCSFVVELE